MRLFHTAAVLAACFTSAQAFSDTSPFILFSTANLYFPGNHKEIQSSTQVHNDVEQILANCPTERYLIINQPNLNNADLSWKNLDKMINLVHAVQLAYTRWSTVEVVGEMDTKEISAYIRKVCANKRQPFIEELTFAPLPSTDDGAKTLKQNDEELSIILEQYKRQGSYTVIYAGGPKKETLKTYTPEFEETTRQELKRQLNPVQPRADNTTNLPLFQKYQYFTPGIFMALITLIVLMTILYGGIAAVASLEVPYGAFDKEMGPAAQKKQQ
ncbi:BIG1-domain-containing protein [Hypoxylon fragiforme]|uniref:BIG1-domain-containing protein n=1 Tax=Hypoxylon fragiforme TaxID=63214 RepID=UPI0020C601A4|nr:BIG1-domain-containing protein [Hypoxylon fragiforme]KAI2608355.1 BIG1-domain-containing protein [Hypoxylon fragiforme]